MVDAGHERFEALLMKKVDGVLEAGEDAMLQRHLQECEACRVELAAFSDVKTTTDAMRARILQDVAHDPLRPDLATRWIDRGGFVVFLGVTAVLLGWTGVAVWEDPKLPVVVKWALLVGGGAALGVFVNVLRLRLGAAGTDPYKEIDR